MEPTGSRTVCLPCESEDEYVEIVNDPARFREWVEGMYEKHPELFPKGFEKGWKLHDQRCSGKLGVEMRRIRMYESGVAYQVRPSFVMPYCVARVSDIEDALYLRRWGVPFDALSQVFGGSAKHYERAFLSLGRVSLVGTTVKHPENLPKHVVGDEKHTKQKGEKCYVTTVVAEGAILGACAVENADEAGLLEGYGEFAQEARAVDPDWEPESVCLDGWEATQKSWSKLFPCIAIVLCFLHSALKLGKLCLKSLGTLRFDLMERVWNVYHASNPRSFAQKLRRLREWAQRTLPQDKLGNRIRLRIDKLCAKAPQFMVAFSNKGCHRTSNMVDRLMSYQDRLLTAQRYFHGPIHTARLVVRAQALLWNFHPYSTRARQKDFTRVTPFEDINGFSYHQSWLQNLLVAASIQ